MFSTPPNSPISLEKLNARFERVEQEAKHQRKLRALRAQEHTNQVMDGIVKQRIRQLMVIQEDP
jgi:hypothetical protein